MIRSPKISSISHSVGIFLALSLTLSFGSAPAANAQTNSYNSDYGSQPAQKGALGLVINWNQQGWLVVTKIVPGGPAANAGITVGDRLNSIDGQNINGLPANQVLSRIVGAVGTTSVLNLWSPNRGNYQAKITRVSVNSLNKSTAFNVGMQKDDDSKSSTDYSTTDSASSNSITNTSSSTSWKTYGSAEQGFTLQYPQGWSVNQNSKTGRIEVNSPGGSQLSVFPFYLQGQSLNVNQAKGLFQAMLKQYAPGHSWSIPSLVGGGLRAMSTSGNINSIAGLALSTMRTGTNGRMIIFKVPNNSNASNDLGTLSQILNSVTITGGAVQNASAGGSNSAASASDYSNSSGSNYAQLPYQNVQFTKFVDPNFGSFSLDVPAGWNVTGAMTKPMAVDLRPWVKAISPDQKIIIFIGDGSIEPRYLPARWLNFLGCPPGSTYRVSTGLVTKVLYYQRADKFAKNYANQRFKKLCDSFNLVSVEHHPDLARQINGTAGVVASDAATVKYDLTIQGTDASAYILAATKKGRTMWWVSQICGVVAAKDHEQQALNIFLRMYRSWQYSPQWTQAQGRQNVKYTRDFMARDRAARAASAAAFNSRMAAMDARHEAFRSRMRSMDAAHSSYMNRMRSSDRAHSNFINFIRDEDTMMDPNTGTKYQVEYGPKYHWVNAAGDTTLGTDSAWSPGVNWTELVAPPR